MYMAVFDICEFAQHFMSIILCIRGWNIDSIELRGKYLELDTISLFIQLFG